MEVEQKDILEVPDWEGTIYYSDIGDDWNKDVQDCHILYYPKCGVFKLQHVWNPNRDLEFDGCKAVSFLMNQYEEEILTHQEISCTVS